MRALTCIAVVSEVERMRDVGMSVYNISEHLKRGMSRELMREMTSGGNDI